MPVRVVVEDVLAGQPVSVTYRLSAVEEIYAEAAALAPRTQLLVCVHRAETATRIVELCRGLAVPTTLVADDAAAGSPGVDVARVLVARDDLPADWVAPPSVTALAHADLPPLGRRLALTMVERMGRLPAPR